MHAWTKSACVVLAWSVLSIILMTAGMKGSTHPAQANIRTTRSTEVILTSTSTLSVAAAPMTATSSPASYVVQPGDSLAGIAVRFAVRGGWPALYKANRRVIGPDPDAIRPGTVFMMPAVRTSVRYTVAAGDTLAGIAAGLAVRGGWPALYKANRRVIGPDPDAIRPGTVLTIPRPAAPSPSRPGLAPRRRPVPPSAPTGTGHHPRPATTGMPQWLKTLLLAIGLLIVAAFLAEPVLTVRRRRQRAAAQALPPTPAGAGLELGGGRRPGADKARIVVADYDRLVVTCSKRDDTVYVLRPPGEDPKTILRVARLVLPEVSYEELAGQLGLPASMPMK
ncbi:MAG: LysM peptidoglycan-binding domain-containing protein [Streptosporangiaceae bacterium]